MNDYLFQNLKVKGQKGYDFICTKGKAVFRRHIFDKLSPELERSIRQDAVKAIKSLIK